MRVARWRGLFGPRLYIRNLSYSLTAGALLFSGALPAESLSFIGALTLAEQHSPELQAQAAAVAAARSTAVAAGRWPDPALVVGIDNLPVTGSDRWSLDRDAMTMQKVGVMQELPNRSKRAAQLDAAQAAITQAEAEMRTRRVSVRRDAALAWLNRYYLECRLRVFDELEVENRLFAGNVQARLAGGKGMPADIVAPQQEAAELADRRDRLQAELAKAKVSLRRWVGVEGDASLAGVAPAFDLDIEHLADHVSEHPELQTYAPMLQAAQAEVRAAESMKRPGWGVELSYGHRNSMYGDMISAQITMGLPLFSGTRIDPQVQARRQDVVRIAAERDAMLREHAQTVAEETAEYLSLARQLARMRDTRLPLAQQKADLQFASYQANKAELTAVLQARREVIDARLALIELENARTALAARLYFSYGEGAQ